jgi:hypothetical protein
MLAKLANGGLLLLSLTLEKIDFSSHSRSWGTERSRKNLALSATPAMLGIASTFEKLKLLLRVQTTSAADVRRSFQRGCQNFSGAYLEPKV